MGHHGKLGNSCGHKRFEQGRDDILAGCKPTAASLNAWEFLYSWYFLSLFAAVNPESTKQAEAIALDTVTSCVAMHGVQAASSRFEWGKQFFCNAAPERGYFRILVRCRNNDGNIVVF